MANNAGIGFFEDAFEQGTQIVKQVGKQVKVTPGSVAKGVGNQVAPNLTPQPKLPGEEKSEDSPDNKKNKIQPKPLTQPKNTNQILKGQFVKQSPAQVAKEQQNLAQVRQELHSSYYQELNHRQKPKQERTAEKIEREEKEEEQKKIIVEQKKAKEDAALVNVRRGTGEKLTGIGG